MKMQYDFKLNNEGIASVIQKLEGEFEGDARDKKYCRKILLALEDYLLEYLNYIPEGTDCKLNYKKSLKKIVASVVVPGIEVGADKLDQAVVGSALFSNIVSSSRVPLGYEYRFGANCIDICIGKEFEFSFTKQMLFALVVALVAGFIFLEAAPSAALTFSDTIFTPITDKFFDLLSLAAVPMIFFFVLTSILSFDSISEVRKIGTGFLIKVFKYLLIAAVLSTIVGIIIWKVSFYNEMSSSGFGEVIAMLLDFIPKNIFVPFTEGNSIQAAVLAVVLGVVVLNLGDRVPLIKDIAFQMKKIFVLLLETIVKLMPVILGMLIFEFVLTTDFAKVLPFIGVLMVMIVLDIIIFAGSVIYTAFKGKISVGRLFKIIMPATITGLLTASSAAGLNQAFDACENKLGVDKKVTGICIPLACAIAKWNCVIELVLISCCLITQYGVQISFGGLIVHVIACIFLSVALPPVPGGSISVYVVVLGSLFLPSELLAVTTLVTMLHDFVCTGTMLGTAQCIAYSQWIGINVGKTKGVK